ncbi:MAG: hypothetical protein IK079_00105, partial [Desulfovibrio sp.]|nr:hypothetical protein [Desulfovibrio sp.]
MSRRKNCIKLQRGSSRGFLERIRCLTVFPGFVFVPGANKEKRREGLCRNKKRYFWDKWHKKIQPLRKKIRSVVD